MKARRGRSLSPGEIWNNTKCRPTQPRARLRPPSRSLCLRREVRACKLDQKGGARTVLQPGRPHAAALRSLRKTERRQFRIWDSIASIASLRARCARAITASMSSRATLRTCDVRRAWASYSVRRISRSSRLVSAASSSVSRARRRRSETVRAMSRIIARSLTKRCSPSGRVGECGSRWSVIRRSFAMRGRTLLIPPPHGDNAPC